jgi:uncharacterized integral membrane protein
MIRYLSWLGRIILFLVLVGFALRNQNEITVRFYLGSEWHAPLILVILIFVIIGVVIGILGSLSYVLRQRRELIHLRRRARDKGLDDDAPQSA